MSPDDPNAAVNALADRFWERVLELDPVQATILGDDRYDDRLPDLGPEGRAAEAALSHEVLRDASAIDADRLSAEQVITRDMLLLVAGNSLEALDHKLYQLAVDHIWGVQTLLVRVAQYQIADSPERLEKLIARFEAYPTLVDQHIATLREGLADGRTSAAVPVRRAIEQMGRMLATPAADSPAVAIAQVADDNARDRVRQAVADYQHPALENLHDFLATEYEPRARQEPGIGSLPGGDAIYDLSIRLMTTVAATAQEVHAFGLEDLDRIEESKDAIAR
ncbi:MAG: DUF885 domain-containing protein, partial [Chloroflexota bacterium]|nr:DUF885 domain-containing protein [Chloroflexota bacterium]